MIFVLVTAAITHPIAIVTTWTGSVSWWVFGTNNSAFAWATAVHIRLQTDSYLLEWTETLIFLGKTVYVDFPLELNFFQHLNFSSKGKQQQKRHELPHYTHVVEKFACSAGLSTVIKLGITFCISGIRKNYPINTYKGYVVIAINEFNE